MLRLCSVFVLIVACAAAACAMSVNGAVRVVDGDTLVVGGERVRLFGIDAPERAQTCQDARGRAWPCGSRATEAMKALVKPGGVRCSGTDRDQYGRLLARCFVGGRDIGEEMVAQGMAFAYRRYALDYVAAEEKAKQARRGIWQGRAELPEQQRAAERDRATAQAAPKANCAIKGNISAHGRIYHLPGGKDYAKTRIDTGRGERWFCSEAEARAAGWRRAGR
ncbi:thermonuclease family protein [Sinirhodobacter populi]|uniref:Thermonuclease family protein n=1 Tax=Paenirhodobacter populi TaxID=2306993 RepID=A0A443K7W9_9RHOB|nr:thermonuclease family protein [Sinirhodobacter populi]